MIKFKDLWKIIRKKISQMNEENKKEFDRDLEFLDTEFFNFLKLIFTKEEIDKRALMKKLRVNEKKFKLFMNMAISKKYVNVVLTSGVEDGKIYRIKSEGIEFLLDFKRLQKKEKHYNVIKWATIILAISAFIQIADIWISKPDTKQTLIFYLGKFIGGVLSLIKELIVPVIFIFVIVMIIKIVKSFKKEKRF